MNRRISENGFSLVELLIAMTLGLILISSMIAVFSGNKRSSELNTATSDLQESARFALNQMARDARMAGFAGCLSIESDDAVNINATGAPSNNLLETLVTGSVAVTSQQWSPPIPAFTPPTATLTKEGTHVLSLQYGDPQPSKLTGPMRAGGVDDPAAAIVTNGVMNIANGDLALITNCASGDLFRVTGSEVVNSNSVLAHAAGPNVVGAFPRAYGTGITLEETRVMKFHSNVYFVADSGQKNSSGEPVYSLFQQSLPYNPTLNPPVELITGVENFRVTYGIEDISGFGVRYVTADSPVFDAARISSVRMGILMVSYDEVADVEDTNTYSLAGIPLPPEGGGLSAGNTHPKDKRIRLAFNTTVKIRNRKFN